MDGVKKLFPSFAPPETWRSEKQDKKLEGDDFTCAYCGYRSEKYQIADHIDGNPENNDYGNLQVVCQTCNLVKHSGMGCVITGAVDLYGQSDYDQNEVMQITRKMRTEGKNDGEIIAFIGLKGKMPFKQERAYLERLYGFVTSRPSKTPGDMYNHWLEYQKKNPEATGKQLQQKL